MIGAGGISHMHAKHARRIEGVEIAAAADVSEKALEKFKEAFPEVTTFTDYKEMLKERKDLQGGGPMIDIGVHCLEMAHYAIGSPQPVTASGNTWTFYGNKPTDTLVPWPNWDHKTYTVEDMAAGMIRFDNGSLLTIEASFVAHIEKDIWTFQVMGEKGGATWDPCEVYLDQDGYMFNLSPGYLPPSGWEVLFEKKMKHFIEVCRG